MTNNQKAHRIYKVLIILVIVGILGLVGWKVWYPKTNSSNTYVAACSSTIQAANNESSQLPDGWNWYEIKDAGLKFAYPKSWGLPTTITNSGVQKYVASFTIGSSGANTMVSLSSDCSDFQSTLSDINNSKFDTLSGPTTTKAINHNQTSYSSLSHWSSNAGNQYKLTTFDVVSIGSINNVTVDYSIIASKESCPDDRLASSDQPNCINQTISDEIDRVISSLQKI